MCTFTTAFFKFTISVLTSRHSLAVATTNKSLTNRGQAFHPRRCQVCLRYKVSRMHCGDHGSGRTSRKLDNACWRMPKWKKNDGSRHNMITLATNRIELLRRPLPSPCFPVLVVVIPNKFIIRLKRNAQGRTHYAINLAEKLFLLGTKRGENLAIGELPCATQRGREVA